MQKAESSVHLEIAVDGEEAIQFLEKWEKRSPVPIVILLDLKLPKISGLDVLKRLKTHPKYKFLPVVVLTSSNELLDIQQAYDLAQIHTFSKPLIMNNSPALSVSFTVTDVDKAYT